MNLLTKQIKIKEKIEIVAECLGVDPIWAVAIAMEESSLGEKQKSPTGCRGIFQLSTIAMKDLLYEMEKYDDDTVDIACGIAFLYLLLKRHGTIKEATSHFCDPKDKSFYIDKVFGYMEAFKNG